MRSLREEPIFDTAVAAKVPKTYSLGMTLYRLSRQHLNKISRQILHKIFHHETLLHFLRRSTCKNTAVMVSLKQVKLIVLFNFYVNMLISKSGKLEYEMYGYPQSHSTPSQTCKRETQYMTVSPKRKVKVCHQQ